MTLIQSADPPVDRNEAVSILRAGDTTRWNAIRVKSPLWIPDLSRISLTGTWIRGGHMVSSYWSVEPALLDGIDFSNTVLEGSNLSHVSLRGANLAGAKLRRAILQKADLTNANLAGADLREADLEGAVLEDAILDYSELTGALFEPHQFESARSAKLFKYYERIKKPHARKPQSVFISYGDPDRTFAEHLQAALARRGVQSFLFSQQASPGAKLHEVMRDGVNKHDRVVLICSRNSLGRPGVLNEIDETLQREAREGGASILIPITIDEYVFSGWSPERMTTALAVRSRVVGDFQKALKDKEAFEEAVERLFHVLIGR